MLVRGGDMRQLVDEMSGLGHEGGEFVDTLIGFELRGGDQFDGLCEDLVPFGEPVKALVDVGRVGIVHETLGVLRCPCYFRPACAVKRVWVFSGRPAGPFVLL